MRERGFTDIALYTIMVPEVKATAKILSHMLYVKMETGLKYALTSKWQTVTLVTAK